MADMSEQAFITVKYGDNQEAVFNPWCPASTLLQCIRRRCRCDKSVLIDLVDLEGQVTNLSSAKEYANEFVSARETYVLIKIEKENEDSKYISLLENLEKFNPELSVKLSNLSGALKASKREKQSRRVSRQGRNKINSSKQHREESKNQS